MSEAHSCRVGSEVAELGCRYQWSHNVNTHIMCSSFVLMIQLGGHPLFRSLKGLRQNKVFDKAGDVAEEVRQRWETSDSPLVLRLQVNFCCRPASHLVLSGGCSNRHERWHCDGTNR